MDMVGRIKSTSPHTSTRLKSAILWRAARSVAEPSAPVPCRLDERSGNDGSGDSDWEIRKLGRMWTPSCLEPIPGTCAVINTAARSVWTGWHASAGRVIPPAIHAHEDLFTQSSLLFLDATIQGRCSVTLARRAKLPVCADPTSETLTARLIPLKPWVGGTNRASHNPLRRKTGINTQESICG
jgi:hypothetical protein